MRKIGAIILALAVSGCGTTPTKEPDQCAVLHERLLRQISHMEAADAIAEANTSVENVVLLAEAATEAAAMAGEMSEAGCSCKPAKTCFDLLDRQGNEP